MYAVKICRSSAGSGKTFTLVCEYLSVVLVAPENFRRVLAITFTNKATEEIKNRILIMLAAFSEKDFAPRPNMPFSSAQRKKYAKEIALFNSVRERVRRTHPKFSTLKLLQNAQLVLDAILHDYTFFGVSTIDSFFQKIVRAFSHELRLPHNYNIELNLDRARNETMDYLLDAVGRPENTVLTDWFRAFVHSRMDDIRSWDVREEVNDLVGELFKEQFYILEPSPFEKAQPEAIQHLRALLQSIKRLFEEQAYNLAEESKQLFESLKVTEEVCFQKKRGPYGYLSEFHATATDPINSYVSQVLSGEKRFLSKIKNEQDEISSQKLEAQLKKLHQFAVTQRIFYWDATLIERNLYALGLLNYADTELKNYRLRKQILLISDASQLIHQVIQQSDTPFLYEKAGNVYQYFLLDEFQDTSHFQWQNIHPLLENGLATGGMALIVGDAKQSIYRWRGAQPGLLAEVEHNWLEGIVPKNIEQLENNFRSDANIIRLNNTLFEQIKQIFPNLLTETYTGAAQKFAAEKINRGKVEINFCPNQTDERLAALLATIQNLVETEGFSWRDIAILTRTNGEASTVARFLQAAQIEIVSSESLIVKHSPAVRIIIYALKLLQAPNDRLVLAELLYEYLTHILHYPIQFFLDIMAAAQSDTEKLALRYLPIAFYGERLALARLPLYELCIEIIHRLQVMPIAPDVLADARNSNIKKLLDTGIVCPDPYIIRFLDIVLEYTERNDENPTGFLDWWAEEGCKKSLIVPQEKNAIRVLTLHKAKGLEFPVVLMPFVDWKIYSSDIILWAQAPDTLSGYAYLPIKMNKNMLLSSFANIYLAERNAQLMDSINLLYVGFTRPRNQLYIWVEKSTPTSPDKIQTVGDLINYTLNQELLLNDNEGLFFENLNHFMQDDPPCLKILPTQTLIQSDKSEYLNTNLSLDKFIYQNWRQRLSIKTRPIELNVEDDRMLWGNVLHDLFAEIESPTQLDVALEKYAQEGSVLANLKDGLRNAITSVFALEEVQDWFNLKEQKWEVWKEQDIILPSGKTLRPDRVLISETKQQIIIIDYKTGDPRPEYAKQLQRYARTLLSITQLKNYTPTLYLLYIAELKIENIPYA